MSVLLPPSPSEPSLRLSEYSALQCRFCPGLFLGWRPPVDRLVTVVTGDQRFPLACCHHLYPEGAFGLPLTAEVPERAQMMDFNRLR